MLEHWCIDCRYKFCAQSCKACHGCRRKGDPLRFKSWKPRTWWQKLLYRMYKE